MRKVTKARIKDIDEKLCDSACAGDLERVKQLLKLGANIHARNDEALCYSASSGHLEVAEYLRQQGCED